MVQFFTREFFEELAERLNGDEEWNRKAGDLNTRIIATCNDRDISVMLDIANGKITVKDTAPDDPSDFKFEGDYASWEKTGRGEADLQTLVMTGKMRFKGSMSKIMSMMGQLNRLVAVIREMPKEF